MLLMSSRMTTVLPTPAPPKRPTLPPFGYGAIRSTTLMPVSSGSTEVAWAANPGAGRRGVDREALFGVDRAALVHGLADHVHDAAERLRSHRDADPFAGVDDLLA